MELLKIFHLDFLHTGTFVTPVTLKGSKGGNKEAFSRGSKDC